MDIEIFLDLFQTVIILCVAVAWPLSISKACKSRTAKGKSVLFDVFLLIGCLFSVLRSFVEIEAFETGGFVFYFGILIYSICCIEIIIDIVLYCRNKKFDKRRENGEKI